MAYPKQASEWGFKRIPDLSALLASSLAYPKQASEWGFKRIPDLSALLASSLAYPKQASEWGFKRIADLSALLASLAYPKQGGFSSVGIFLGLSKTSVGMGF